MKPIVCVLTAMTLGAMLSFSAEPEAREFTAKDGTVVKYRWSTPEKPEPGKSYPLVLFLHGSGERGDDNKAQLRHGVLPILDGAVREGESIFLIAPQCPENRWWSPMDKGRLRLSAAGHPNPLLEAVMELIDEILRTQSVDPKRFLVTGISMGGFATWDLLGRVPQKIAGAVPVCGGGDVSLVGRYKSVPIWAFHGEADSVVPARATREMISTLEIAGGKPKSTYYPAVEHDSWTMTYADPAVIRWMLDQRRD